MEISIIGDILGFAGIAAGAKGGKGALLIATRRRISAMIAAGSISGSWISSRSSVTVATSELVCIGINFVGG
jgi:hypothetical protein